MEEESLAYLVRGDLKRQHKLIASTFQTESLNHSSLVQNTLRKLKADIEKERISHRQWIAIQFPSINLDIILAKSNRLSIESCVLLSKHGKVILMNKTAELNGVQIGMSNTFLGDFDVKVRVLHKPASSQIAVVMNDIQRLLQNFDREIEFDEQNALFLLDVTNYMAEKGLNKSQDVCLIIKNAIFEKHKVHAQTGVGSNILMSILSLQQVESRNENIEQLDHPNCNIPLEKVPWISESLKLSLKLSGILKIGDILEKFEVIQNMFPIHILKSFLRIYYGISRSYHEAIGEMDSLKVSRMLEFREYDREELSAHVKEMVTQLVCDMRHYKKIGRSVKLQLTKIDHNPISTKRVIQRIEADYFEVLEHDCLAMVGAINSPGSMLIRVTLQVFELQSIEMIDSVNISFAQKLKKLIQNGAEEIEQKQIPIFKKQEKVPLQEIGGQLNKKIASQSDRLHIKDKDIFEESKLNRNFINQNSNSSYTEEDHDYGMESFGSSSIQKKIQNVEKDYANANEDQRRFFTGNSNIKPMKFSLLDRNKQQEEPSQLQDDDYLENNPSINQNLLEKDFDYNSNGSSKSREDLNTRNSEDAFDNLIGSKKDYLLERFTCPLCGNQIDCKGNFSLLNKHIDKCLLKQNNANEEDTSDARSVQNQSNLSQHPGILSSSLPQHQTALNASSTQKKPNLIEFRKRGRPPGSKSLMKQMQPKHTSLIQFGFKK